MLQPELKYAYFENLIETHSKKLLNRAYYLLPNKEDAEDVVQKNFMTAFAKRESLSDINSVESLLWGIRCFHTNQSWSMPTATAERHTKLNAHLGK